MHQAEDQRAIVIGKDVWLGANVIVLAGATICDDGNVAAGSAVTKGLPVQCIAGGVRANVVGMRPLPGTAE